MIDRLRALLAEPLDPRVGRAIVALAGAVLLGFAALFVLAAHEPDPNAEADAPPAVASKPASAAADLLSAPANPDPFPQHRQDPQDQRGSAAARRAARALRSHRALQHVPYRSGKLTIELAAARGRRAVLRVSAATVQDARAGWRLFLHRYRDSGRAYIAIIRGKDGKRGG